MHDHSHHREDNIKVAVFLNLLFTVIEIIGGLWTNSLAILSDALHDFGDSIILISSWILEKKSQKKPDSKRTFGYQRLSLLSALIASIVLVIGSIFILSKAIPRLINPQPVNAAGMIALSIVGIAFNGISFLRLKKGISINEKAIAWHLLEDVLGWVAVLLGSVIILIWDNHIIDPIMTIGYSVFIFIGVIRNLKEALNIFLQGVPDHIDIDHLKEGLLSLKGVLDVHDIHIWSLEGETDVFTGHIVVKKEMLRKQDNTRKIIKEELKKHHIEHSTIELESKGFCSGIECKAKGQFHK